MSFNNIICVRETVNSAWQVWEQSADAVLEPSGTRVFFPQKGIALSYAHAWAVSVCLAFGGSCNVMFKIGGK